MNLTCPRPLRCGRLPRLVTVFQRSAADQSPRRRAGPSMGVRGEGRGVRPCYGITGLAAAVRSPIGRCSRPSGWTCQVHPVPWPRRCSAYAAAHWWPATTMGHREALRRLSSSPRARQRRAFALTGGTALDRPRSGSPRCSPRPLHWVLAISVNGSPPRRYSDWTDAGARRRRPLCEPERLKKFKALRTHYPPLSAICWPTTCRRPRSRCALTAAPSAGRARPAGSRWCPAPPDLWPCGPVPDAAVRLAAASGGPGVRPSGWRTVRYRRPRRGPPSTTIS